MQAYDVIMQLTVARSQARREHIVLDAYANNCMDFFEAVRLATDPFVFYDVRKVAEIVEDDGAPGTLTFAEFRLLCERLRTRSLVGEAARGAILAAAERCHAPTWNTLYRRILLKDLQVVEVTMINRLLKRLGSIAEALAVPLFGYQTIAAKPITKLPTGCHLIDVGLTGDRAFAVLDKSAVLLNSFGQHRVAPSHLLLEQALQPLAERLPKPMVLDGVVLATGEYVLFDIVPLVEFRDRRGAKTQQQRRDMLESLLISGVFSTTRLVRVLPYILINFDTEEGRIAFTEFSQHAIAQGYHNLVVKKPNALYQAKLNRAWLSWPITLA